MVIDDDHLKPEVRNTLETLSRDEQPPSLGVHVMSQFLFCPRAGIIASETNLDDTGSEFHAAPALGGIPRYEIDRIERKLEELSAGLKRLLLTLTALTGVGIVVAFREPLFGVFVLVFEILGILISSVWWRRDVANWWTLRKRLREARRAKPREPNWNQNAQQEVHWWELIAAGFESIEPTRPLQHHDIALKGRPWRILHRGDQRLPVIRIRVNEDGGPMGAFQPRTQQQARMAAYAFLIETCERGHAEWVIVLFNNGDRGVAFPIGPHEWDAFRKGLPQARAEFRKYAESARHRPRPADEGRACRGCPFGEPRRVGLRPTILNGITLLPYKTSDRQNCEYHCTCGDRFIGEVPPHERARELGLTD
jgi:hypothetical protein